ncbi:hypothetical protein NEOLEDRAFT_1130870 [Neolentinus lepideus HHB14362 ss-1]|uniref:Mitochondrial import inner membrane translocase subunit TIM54 n=1 Tax=Neolentinus lepideus HHB14362 ss-1 TaxID=1314782 RepID=A0A165TXV9_9AGAM|nr:hypothetical protein NEOLEDRAFT_1130870 [Neolentinus lepideus HHB14362 ss-1]
MSTDNVHTSSPSSSTPPSSGVRIVLGRLGIPSWLLQRPKLPSRNWLIFLSITSTVTGCYIYDRRECKRIRKEYQDKVRFLAEEPLGSLDLPRKVVVYAAKWPGDDDWDRGMRYFRKYVKPILVAAAIDYDMIKGQRHGDITRRIADEIKTHRRELLGLDKKSDSVMPSPTDQSPEVIRRRELEGGLVIVGRPTFKEFMAGLKKGWSETLRKVDREEELAQTLADDGVFDELEPELEKGALEGEDGEPIPTPSKLPSSVYSPFQQIARQRSIPRPKSKAEEIAETLDTPPSTITTLPPMLLVPFTNHLGFKQIPYMLWDFFNERAKVRAGSEAAYKLVMRHTRPFIGPPLSDSLVPSDTSTSLDVITPITTNSDLGFDIIAETFYKSSTLSLPSEIAKARKEYYNALPARLKASRDIARGVRELTKDERANPPPTEVELRAERMKKESRWTADEEGWEVVRPDKPTEWDPRFADALEVFVEPPTEESEKVS